jgi:hypothetical protein
MHSSNKRAILPQGIARAQSGGAAQFIEIRDPRTLRLLCRYNPATREIEIKAKNQRAVVVDLRPFDK